MIAFYFLPAPGCGDISLQQALTTPAADMMAWIKKAAIFELQYSIIAATAVG
jgi:hypothetical protein